MGWRDQALRSVELDQSSTVASGRALRSRRSVAWNGAETEAEVPCAGLRKHLVEVFPRRKRKMLNEHLLRLPKIATRAESFSCRYEACALQFAGLVDEKSQHHEQHHESAEVLVAMSVIVFEVVAVLVLQGIEGFVFYRPSSSCQKRHPTCLLHRSYGEVGEPSPAQLVAFAVQLHLFQNRASAIIVASVGTLCCQRRRIHSVPSPKRHFPIAPEQRRFPCPSTSEFRAAFTFSIAHRRRARSATRRASSTDRMVRSVNQVQRSSLPLPSNCTCSKTVPRQFHGRFTGKQSVHDEDEFHAATFLEKPRKQSFERVRLAILLRHAILFHDGFDGDRQDLPNTRMGDDRGHDAVPVADLAVLGPLLHAMIAPHLVGGEIAGAVDEDWNQVLVAGDMKSLQITIAPQPADGHPNRTMRPFRIDGVEPSLQRRVRRRALNVKQRTQVFEQCRFAALLVEIQHRRQLENENRQAAHQTVMRGVRRDSWTVAGLDPGEHIAHLRQQNRHKGAFLSFLGHAEASLALVQGEMLAHRHGKTKRVDFEHRKYAKNSTGCVFLAAQTGFETLARVGFLALWGMSAIIREIRSLAFHESEQTLLSANAILIFIRLRLHVGTVLLHHPRLSVVLQVYL